MISKRNHSTLLCVLSIKFYGRYNTIGDKMNTLDYLKFLAEDIHTTVIATVNEKGLPVTSAIDIMDYDEDGLYFLTAKGKSFYNRLKDKEYISLTGIKGNDTMRCVSVSVKGKVKEIGRTYLDRLIEKNPYVNKIYPTEKSKQALTVFKIYDGSGEWFDLSKKPIERKSFNFDTVNEIICRYCITDNCMMCGACGKYCPQGCISFANGIAVIKQNNCLHCGNCYEVCPVNAVMKRG